MSVLDSLRAAFRVARENQPGFTEQMAEEALTQILAALGGEQVVMPRTKSGKPGRPGIDAGVHQRAYQDALGSASTQEIVERHGISRATLYRIVKKGPAK